MFRHPLGLSASLIGALLAIATTVAARASSVFCNAAPEEKVVRSPDGGFAVRIVPGHRDGFEPASPRDATAPPPVERSARAVLYEVLAGGSMRQLSTFELNGPWGPYEVLLTNDGQRLVTRGEWCVPSDDFVIYRSDGTFVRGFRSWDLLVDSDRNGPVKWLPDVRIDDERNRLVLEVSGCRRALDCTQRQVRAIEIDLADGEPVRPPRPLFPFIEPRVTVHPLAAEEQAALGDFREQCPEAPAENVPHLSFAALSKELLFSVTPVYTETARRARLGGRVVLQLALERRGYGRYHVRCVDVLRDLPMGLGEAASRAMKTWVFRPAALGQPYATTTVAVDFAMVEVPPPEN